MDLVEKQHKYGWKNVEKQQYMQYTEKKPTEYLVSNLKGYGCKYEMWYCAFLTNRRQRRLGMGWMRYSSRPILP